MGETLTGIEPIEKLIHQGGTAPPISVLSAQRLTFRHKSGKRKMEESNSWVLPHPGFQDRLPTI
ncbi:hypothetical protein FD725_13025 [Nostoc sp. TCL26-01]|nr:hypothetical protein FD725_13025 [Nostoc sp. TCL26-01]